MKINSTSLGILAGIGLLLISFQNCAPSAVSESADNNSVLDTPTSPTSSLKIQDAFYDAPADFAFDFESSGTLRVRIEAFDGSLQEVTLNVAQADILRSLLNEVNYFENPSESNKYYQVPDSIKSRFYQFLDDEVILPNQL